MGRSVSYPPNADAVTFQHLDFDEDTDFDWEVIQPFQDRLKRLWPSVDDDDRWLGREHHVVASNDHAFFGVSEYGGLVAYWVLPREWDGYGPDTAALSHHWCEQIADKFERAFGDLVKLGAFSNGGGIYGRRDGEPVGPDQFETNPITISGLLTDG